MELNPTPRKFTCVSHINFKALAFSYRHVRVYRKNITSEQWKLKQYTPTNRIKAHTFASLDDAAAYIDNVLDNIKSDENGNPVIWTVRASTLKWFPK